MSFHHKPTHSKLLALAAFVALATVSCGALSTTSSSTSSSTTASLRVVHGSPDAGSIDVRLDTTTGSTLAAAAAYGSVGYYASVSTGSHNVTLLAAGGSTATLTCLSPTMYAGYGYTVVVAGAAAKGYGTTGGVQCQFFIEPVYATPSGDYTLAVHHASPAAAAAGYSVLSFGPYAAGSTAYQAPAGAVTFAGISTSGTGYGTVGNDVAVGVTGSPGIGFWFAPSTSSAPSSVLATELPSQGLAGAKAVSGVSDTGNLLPTGTLVNFSVYLVDGQGSNLIQAIGAFD